MLVLQEQLRREADEAEGSARLGESSAPLRIGDVPPSAEQLRLVHKAIKAVTDGMEQLKVNTAIAALIDLNGEMLR